MFDTCYLKGNSIYVSYSCPITNCLILKKEMEYDWQTMKMTDIEFPGEFVE